MFICKQYETNIFSKRCNNLVEMTFYFVYNILSINFIDVRNCTKYFYYTNNLSIHTRASIIIYNNFLDA